MDAETMEKASRLAEEMQQLLERYMPVNPTIAGPAMDRVRQIRKEIAGMGVYFTVDQKCKVNKRLEATMEVVVTLYSPRPGLSEEELEPFRKWQENELKEK